MPQPKAPEAPAPDATDDDVDAREWDELVERVTTGDGRAAHTIRLALELENDRADVLEQISDNRVYLRLQKKNRELNEDEVEFLETFYPEKERGARRDKSDIDATRKARLAARKNGKDAD